MKIHELSIFEKNHVQQTASKVGIDDITLLSDQDVDTMLADFVEPKTPLDDVWRANEASVQARRYRRLQARVDQLTKVVAGTAPLPPTEQFATIYGFTDTHVAEQFQQQQQAAVAELAEAKRELAEAEKQAEFDRAVALARDENDYVRLIMIGDKDDHPFKQRARTEMAILWPGYDSWRD